MPPKKPRPRIVVIANPAAGSDTPVLATLNDALGKDADWDVTVTHEAGDAVRAAKLAAGGGADFVAAYGGDGTVMEVADGLAGSEVPMLILPGGTANVLAHDLGIPLALADAAALVIGEHRVLPLDVGEAGDRRFVLRLAMGLEAEMDLRADRERKDRLGVWAYPLAALEAVRAAPVATYRITADGETHEAEGVNCVIANSGNLGLTGVTLAPDILVTDGLLDIVVLTTAEATSLLSVATDVLAGRPPADAAVVKRWKAREVRIDSDPSQDVVCDGEPMGCTPVTARILPGAVKVVVPAEV